MLMIAVDVVAAIMWLAPVLLVREYYLIHKHGKEELWRRRNFRRLARSQKRQTVLRAIAGARSPITCQEIMETTDLSVSVILLTLMSFISNGWVSEDLTGEEMLFSLNYKGYQVFEQLQAAREE